MTQTLLARQYYDDNGGLSKETTIIIICVAVALKIVIIASLCYWRRTVMARRRAKDCHCYDDANHCCKPWWFWRQPCHCGQIEPPALAPWLIVSQYQKKPQNYEPYRGQETLDHDIGMESQPSAMNPTYTHQSTTEHHQNGHLLRYG